MLDDLFGPAGGQITAAQECARAVLVFVYGLVLVRLAGRRVFGKWAALDIIVSIVLGSNLSRCLTGSAPLWGTLVATTLMFGVHGLLTVAAAHAPWVSRLVEGSPAVLGRDGTIDAHAMRRHRVSEAALDEALRTSGLTDAAQARLILLEPNGHISVLKRCG